MFISFVFLKSCPILLFFEIGVEVYLMLLIYMTLYFLWILLLQLFLAI